MIALLNHLYGRPLNRLSDASFALSSLGDSLEEVTTEFFDDSAVEMTSEVFGISVEVASAVFGSFE